MLVPQETVGWWTDIPRGLHGRLQPRAHRSPVVSENWRGCLPDHMSTCTLTEIQESLEQWRPGGRKRYKVTSVRFSVDSAEFRLYFNA